MHLNDQLYTFTIVVETGSFSQAAEKLFVSIPAVIKQINTLEGKLGFPLLIRSHQGVSVTPAGRLMYNEAKLLLSHFQESVTAARALSQPAPKLFRIGTSIFKPYQPFMSLWEKLRPAFPGYALQITPFDDDHNTVTSLVQSLGKRFDFLVAACDSKSWLAEVSFHKLWDDPFCAAVPVSHPLSARKKITLNDLQGESVYLFSKGDAHSIDVIWDALAAYPAIHLLPTSYYDMDLFNKAAQETRIIISIASWAHVHPSFRSIPMDWTFTTPYGLLYAKKAPDHVKKFISLLGNED